MSLMNEFRRFVKDRNRLFCVTPLIMIGILASILLGIFYWERIRVIYCSLIMWAG